MNLETMTLRVAESVFLIGVAILVLELEEVAF